MFQYLVAGFLSLTGQRGCWLRFCTGFCRKYGHLAVDPVRSGWDRMADLRPQLVAAVASRLLERHIKKCGFTEAIRRSQVGRDHVNVLTRRSALRANRIFIASHASALVH